MSKPRPSAPSPRRRHGVNVIQYCEEMAVTTLLLDVVLAASITYPGEQPPIPDCAPVTIRVTVPAYRGGRTIIVRQNIGVRAGSDTMALLNAVDDGLAESRASGQDVCAPGVGRDIRSYYYAVESPGAPITRSPPIPVALEYLSGAPVLSAFGLPDRRPDPSDPFYHSGQ
jgi:hypothetical protein